MTVSALMGLGVAAFAILSGWGPLVAFGLYSLSGSLSLLVTATLAALAPEPQMHLPKRPERKSALA